MQQGDVLLRQTTDNGEITIEQGLVEMSGGLETAAYLSMFGGSLDDTGLAGSGGQWWGNASEVDPARQMRSQTQYLLQSIPATSGNRLRIQDAVARDLQWMLDGSVATSLDAVVRLAGLNTVHIVITVVAQGSESTIKFTENWKAGT